MNTTTASKPRTLIEAVRYFSDLDVCTQYLARLRWPDGPVCPRCGGTEHSYLTTRRLWKCKGCKRQFSVKVGTIFEQSPIGLDKWLPAVWLLANSKNGVSSHELGRALGITQKSAWHVFHRVREAMRTGSFEKLDGSVEADEAYIGGQWKNMHAADRDRKMARGNRGKTMVVGALQRGTDENPSQVNAEVMLDTEWDSPRGYVRRTVEPAAELYTDAHLMYRALRDEYKHSTIDHSRGEYARGAVTTNGIENFWSLLKRGIFGTYVDVDPEHLHRYVDERVFAFNERHQDDLGRFELVLAQSIGRRLTWEQLTA